MDTECNVELLSLSAFFLVRPTHRLALAAPKPTDCLGQFAFCLASVVIFSALSDLIQHTKQHRFDFRAALLPEKACQHFYELADRCFGEAQPFENLFYCRQAAQQAAQLGQEPPVAAVPEIRGPSR